MAWFTTGYTQSLLYRGYGYVYKDTIESGCDYIYVTTNQNTRPNDPYYWVFGKKSVNESIIYVSETFDENMTPIGSPQTITINNDYNSAGQIFANRGGWYETNLPIFYSDDTTNINKYINDGDWSGAINAEDLMEKIYANWTIAYTNAENTNYSIAVDCPQFNDNTSLFYGKGSLASVHYSVAWISDVEHPFYQNSIAYGTTWNASLQALISNGNTAVGEQILEKIVSLLDIDHIAIRFYVSYFDNETEREVRTARGYVVFDHATVDNYGFSDETHGDTINFKSGVILDDTDSDVSNNEVPDETSDTVDSESVANVTGGNLLTRTYALTPQETQGIGAFLWGASFMQNIKLLNTSPIENVVTCKLFPFELGGTDKNVYIGNVDSGTQAKQVDSTVVKFESDSITIPLYYSNQSDNLKFLDYAPYTKIELFLPFIGLKELPTDLCIGKTIKLVWLVDLVCGTLQTDIIIGGKCLFIYNSQVGVDIPLTAQNLAQVQGAYIQNAIGGGVSLASGNPMGAVNSILNSATQQYHSQSSGTPSPATALHGTFTPYLIITRPTAKTVGDVTNKDGTISRCKAYKQVMGCPCYEVKPLGSYEGYTEVENPRVSVDGALKVEIDEINRLLDLGVIMPTK